jgi:glycosyltransferase involved in cell wall biosynthesis
MSNKILLSIIIPTYNRVDFLIKILNLLKRSSLSFRFIEIVICDSSPKGTSYRKILNFKNNNKFLNIKYFDVKKNIHSLKRNFGIEKATGNYVIFLDDDCYPEKDFLKKYYLILSKEKNNKVIYCGSVCYPEILINNNFVRYRQSRHFVVQDNSFNSELPPSKVVTMNMGFKKNSEIIKTNFFNKNFNAYGFEDYEFAYRLKKFNFKIKSCSPLIHHNDFRDFSLYLKKIYFLGLESMKYLTVINLSAAKQNNFYKLENFFLIKFFLNFNFFRLFLKCIEKFSIISEKRFLYFPIFYKLGIASSYLIGCVDRNINLFKDSNIKSWYK